MSRGILFFLFSAFSFQGFALEYPLCDSVNLFKQPCYERVENIRPTQFNVGAIRAQQRIKRIERAYAEDDFYNYINNRPAPVVVGSDGGLYIYDRHHLSYGIYHADISEESKVVLIEVKRSFESLDEQSFRDYMKKNSRVYLYDKGLQRSFDHLPRYINKLGDDVYRSFIWLAISEGVIHKPDDSRPYFEFFLADLIREKIDLNSADQTIESLKNKLPLLDLYL